MTEWFRDVRLVSEVEEVRRRCKHRCVRREGHWFGPITREEWRAFQAHEIEEMGRGEFVGQPEAWQCHHCYHIEDRLTPANV